jgi:TolA-binding protein
VRGYLALYQHRNDEARRALEYAASSLSGEARGEAIRILAFLRNGSEAELTAVAAAHLAAYQGYTVRAADLLVDRLRRAPVSSARPGIELWAGELALRGGALDRAEPILQTIPDRYPDSGEAPIAMLKLAEAKATAGQSAAAVQLLEDLIIKYPKSAITPIARRRLSELQGQVPKS